VLPTRSTGITGPLESIQGNAADPSYIYVDLGQVDTIHSVVINWEKRGGRELTRSTSAAEIPRGSELEHIQNVHGQQHGRRPYLRRL